MAMDAPDYVQGKYSVAQRDVIFDKAAQYPDPSGALPNQVPMVFPDGTVNWRQLSAGGETGTANANIAVVESTNKASKTYYPGDLLIYNGQLYVATVVISSGAYLYPDFNILPTRADMQFLSLNGKGENCFRNWYFYGGGSQQGGGQFPINQRGLTSYTDVGETIDGWSQTGGTTTVEAYDIRHTSPANASSDLYQVVDRPFNPGAASISFGVLSSTRFFSGSVNFGALSEETVVYSGDDCQLLLAPVSGNRIKAIIRVYAGQNVTLIAAKLELGPISTLCLRSSQIAGVYRLVDTPPDYGAELAKCQRYYFRKHFAAYETIGFGVVVGSWNVVGFDVGLGVQMASDSPTMSISDMSSLTASVPVAFSITGSTTTLVKACGAMAKVQLENVTVTTPGACYFYSNNAGGLDIEFSAEP